MLVSVIHPINCSIHCAGFYLPLLYHILKQFLAMDRFQQSMEFHCRQVLPRNFFMDQNILLALVWVTLIHFHMFCVYHNAFINYIIWLRRILKFHLNRVWFLGLPFLVLFVPQCTLLCHEERTNYRRCEEGSDRILHTFHDSKSVHFSRRMCRMFAHKIDKLYCSEKLKIKVFSINICFVFEWNYANLDLFGLKYFLFP